MGMSHADIMLDANGNTPCASCTGSSRTGQACRSWLETRGVGGHVPWEPGDGQAHRYLNWSAPTVSSARVTVRQSHWTGSTTPREPRGREAAGRVRHTAGRPAPSCAAKGRAMGQAIIPGPQTASLCPSVPLGIAALDGLVRLLQGETRVLASGNAEGLTQVTKVKKASAEQCVVCVVETHTRREKCTRLLR